MAYTKTQWANDTAPAINATNLNKIEQGIFNNDTNISGINGTIGVDTNTWIGTTAYGEGDIVIYNDKIYQNISGTSTTTNPAEDTTNWNEITIFDTDSINDDLIDKTKFINNSSTNSGVKTYSCDYINNTNTYSTTEVNTGKKWIDGKPIYRIVIIQDNVADGTNILTNVDQIVSINGMGDPGTGALRNLPYYEFYNNQKYSCRFEMITNSLTLDSMLGGSSHSAMLRVVIEYTKTTD